MTGVHKHGDHLGDGNRWCEHCKAPVADRPTGLEMLFPFAGKKCPVCGQIWPEHVADFMAAFEDEYIRGGTARKTDPDRF